MSKRTALRFLLVVSIWLLAFPLFAQSDIPAGETEVADTELVSSEADVTQPEVTETEPAVATLEFAEEEDEFDVELEGHKTWTIRYGLGHPLGLAPYGVSSGDLALDQTLSVDIVGEALSILTIEAHYDDQLPQTMQSLVLRLDTERLDGVLGDFTFGGVPQFTAYSKKMKGLQLEYLLGDAVMTAVVSKSEGISERVVFLGQTSHAEIEYAERNDSEPSEPMVYQRNLNGLYSYPLQALYTEEFSDIHFQFTASPSLQNILRMYEVGFLFDVLDSELQLEMREQEYQVLEADDQVLLLQRDPMLLIRERLRDLVDMYNEQADLSGSETKDYPFTAGTDYELRFLSEVAPFAQLVVDDIIYPLEAAERRRFYDLGRSNVLGNSVLAEISSDGKRFETVTSYRLPNFKITVHEEAGILECDFPSTFFTSFSILRVGFDYAVSEGAFMLGLSLIPGSERVMLNSEPLERDVHYIIDYEVGLLLMMIDVADTDVVQVDYELHTGGFGATSDYASYFYGLTLELPVIEGLTINGNLLQLADATGSSADSDHVRTMPNRHTIAGAEIDVSFDDFKADVVVGYNQDRFPFDDNERAHEANEINAVAVGEGYVLFGHHAGMTVNDGGNWQTYGLGTGLSSQIVQAIAFGDGVVYLGTDDGLTVVHLDGTSPFDRSGNWTRYYEADGLPDSSVTAVLVHEGTVWVGTSAGLVTLPADGLDPFGGLTPAQGEGFGELPSVTALAAGNDVLYIGTDDGVYRFDLAGEQLDLVSGTDGSAVNDLAVADEMLYVATDRGLRSYRSGNSVDWLVLGEPVYAVASANDSVYYGVGTGVMVVKSGQVAVLLAGVKASALEPELDGVWLGTRASDDYVMNVWLLTESMQTFSEAVTGISGQDPYVFTDRDAADHTATGWIARATFNHNPTYYTLSGSVELYPPTFRPIGSFSRDDRTGWVLSGDIPLGSQAQVSVDHEYRLTGQLSETPRERMDNGLSLEWSFGDGPDWMAAIRHVETNEVDAWGLESTRRLSTSFSVSDTFFRDALGLTLSCDRTEFVSDRWEEQWRNDGLALAFNWQVSSELRTHGSWSRPTHFAEDELTGTEKLTWIWDWETSLGFADLNVDYSADWSRGLLEETGELDHEAELRFDVMSFQLLDWSVVPELTLIGDHASTDTNLEGELVVRSTVNKFALRTTVRGHLTDLGRPVFHEGAELSLNAKYSGWADMSASLTYTGDREAAVRANDRMPSSSDSLVGRLIWTPDSGLREELRVELRVTGSETERAVRVTIDNDFSTSLSAALERWLDVLPELSVSIPEGFPIADVHLDSQAEYNAEENASDISFSTTATVFAAIAPRWNMRFGSTYEIGHRSTIGLYQSFLFELTFEIEF